MKNNAGRISGIIIGIIYISAFAAIGAYSASFAERYLGKEKNMPKAMLVIFAFVIMAYFCAIIHLAAHEAGHLVFGKMTGYQFKSYRIFNLMWQKDADGKVKFYRYSLAGTGGQCIMGPPDMAGDQMPFVLYNLGGIIMNLVLSLIFWGISLLQGENSFGRAICIAMVIVGAAYFLANGILLPACTNDGSNTINIARSEKARKAFWVQMKGVVLLTEGRRIKDFPEEWFSMPDEKGLQNTMEAVMAVYVCDRLMDEHKFEETKETIDQLLNKETAINEIHRKMLKTNAVFCGLLKLKEDGKDKGQENNQKDENIPKAKENMPKVGENISTKAEERNNKVSTEKDFMEIKSVERYSWEKGEKETGGKEFKEQEQAQEKIRMEKTREEESREKGIEEKIRKNIKDYMDKDLEQFWKGMKTNPSVLRTRYAYEMIYEQNEEAANKCLEEFEKAAKVYPYPVEIEAEMELINLVPFYNCVESMTNRNL